ncbi:MAG: IS110 family transposase [Peptoanaerobacter stomatis]|uniref:IS110 family transposase n=1 Tax=Peptoanaerobacter stomatis TaxID=796937 RepID=UPI003FA0A3F2
MSEKIVVGIDVSKAFSDICILSPNNNIIKRIKIYNAVIGMNSLISVLEKVEDEYEYEDRAVIIMEATAHYHQILVDFFRKHKYEVIVINPIQSGALKNINIRKIKSDKTDAYNIALLYRIKNYNETITHSDTVNSIKKLCRQHKELTDEIVEHINCLIAFLDISFPDLQGKTSLSLLEKYPTVQDVLSPENKQDMIQLIKENSHKSYSYAEAKYEKLLQAAEKSIEVCIVNLSSSVLIQTRVSVIFSLQEALKAINDEIKKLSLLDEKFHNDIMLLQSIPGIGEYTACVVLSELGYISNFSKPKELVAFFGLDPGVSQSGTYNRKNNKISKRGSPHVRLILHMLAKSNVYPNRNREYLNPVMRAYFEKKIAEKPYKVVMCAIMRKMVQMIFAVLRNQKSFELRTPEEHQKLIRENSKQAA